MSPEQCLGQRVGARSDLYSLGVVLYEMLAGRPPFIDVLPSAVLVKQATVAPPPLPKLADVPKSLTLAVHTLLAKKPEDRPRTAADARVMLLRSLRYPDRVEPELEPLSSTVAALSNGTSLPFRVGAPLALVLVFSAALFAWGYTSQTPPEHTQNIAPTASFSSVPVSTTHAKFSLDSTPVSDSGIQPAKEKTTAALPVLSAAEARRIAASVLHTRPARVEVVATESGPAIVAVQDGRKSGTTRFAVIQKRGHAFQIISRGPLDVDGFRRAIWSIETIDSDDDGYPEVLFVGASSSDRPFARRVVLYVPNERRTYAMFLTGDVTQRGTPKIIWSANASRAEAAVYRTMLRLKARALLNLAKNR